METSLDQPAADAAPAAAPVLALVPDRDLSADDILAAPDRFIERFYVPEWKGHVYLRTISGTERDAFEASLVTAERTSTENIRAKLLVQVLCDKEGNKLFSQEDIEKLGAKSAAGLSRCYNRASEINAVSNKDVDDLAGNSGGGASATSS